MTAIATPRGTLVAIEGIDGVGKTELATRVAAGLADLDFTVQSNRELASAPAFARESMAGVAALLWPAEDTSYDHLLGPHYWLYLQALWYTLLSRFVVEPRLRSGARLVADGWYFKFYAKLRLRGFADEFLGAVYAAALEPDVVVLVDADVESVWERKTFRQAEMGLHAAYPELGRESFVDYQSHVRSVLGELASERGWPSVRVAPGEPAPVTAERVAEAVRAAVTRPTDARAVRAGVDER